MVVQSEALPDDRMGFTQGVHFETDLGSPDVHEGRLGYLFEQVLAEVVGLGDSHLSNNRDYLIGLVLYKLVVVLQYIIFNVELNDIIHIQPNRIDSNNKVHIFLENRTWVLNLVTCLLLF